MTVDEAKRKLRGPMVSVATPFKDNFELDLVRLKSNIRFMIDHGVRAEQGTLLVAAAGGEFPMLRLDERKLVIKASLEAAEGQVPVAVGMQFNSTADVVDIARFAGDAGAVVGQLSAPFYYHPTMGDILRLFQAVSDETGFPVMIYTNWWNTPLMNAAAVERLSEITNVVALKWSAPVEKDYLDGLKRFCPKLAVIDNRNHPIEMHKAGAVGFISHVSNFWPEYPLSMWNLLNEKKYTELNQTIKDFNEPWQAWTKKVMQETFGEGPFIKAAMDEVGLKGGPPRPPSSSVSSELREELHRLFLRAGVPKVS